MPPPPWLVPLWIVPLLAGGAFLEAPPRALQVAVLAALAVALWGAGRRIAGWLLPDAPPLSAAVAAFTAGVGLVTALTLMLGTCGGLRPPEFLLGVALLYGLCLALPRPPHPEARTSPEPAAPRAARLEAVVLAAALAALVVSGAAALREERLAPPEAFDDLSYHLPAVATWHRYGDLRMMKLAYGDPSTPFYPIVGELWAWALLAPFDDSDVAARWSQLPFALFSALAAAAVARRLGLSRRSAALAALLYLSIRHVMPGLALSAGNDHVAGFFALAALNGVLATVRRPGRRPAAYTGLALGLLAGTKYLALFYCVTLFLGLGIGLALRRPPVRRIVGILGLVLGVALAAGGYTYLRNAWTTGNPVFPAPVHLFGFEVFPGWALTGLADRLELPDAEIDVRHFLLQRPDLFGPLAPWTLVPAAVLAPLVALFLAWRSWRRNRAGALSPVPSPETGEGNPVERAAQNPADVPGRGLPPLPGQRKPEPGEGDRGGEGLLLSALVLALPAIFFLEFLAFMHDHRDPRYVLAGMALAGVAVAWLLEKAGARVGAVARSLLALWIVHELLRRFEPGLPLEALGIAVLLGAGALAVHLGPRFRAGAARPAFRRSLTATALVLLAAGAFPLGRLVETYQKRKLRDEPAALAIEALLRPQGARLAYVGWNQPYLYFGSRLQNRVEIVPHSWDAEARFHDWGREPEVLPFDRRRADHWLAHLDRLGIDHVVVLRKDDPGPEQRWIHAHPHRFELAFEHPTAEIWRVVPPPSL